MQLHSFMQYEWRADKDERNIVARGIAFPWAIQIWEGDVIDALIRDRTQPSSGALPSAALAASSTPWCMCWSTTGRLVTSSRLAARAGRNGGTMARNSPKIVGPITMAQA